MRKSRVPGTGDGIVGPLREDQIREEDLITCFENSGVVEAKAGSCEIMDMMEKQRKNQLKKFRG
jgi:hypothetical protein